MYKAGLILWLVCVMFMAVSGGVAVAGYQAARNAVRLWGR